MELKGTYSLQNCNRWQRWSPSSCPLFCVPFGRHGYKAGALERVCLPFGRLGYRVLEQVCFQFGRHGYRVERVHLGGGSYHLAGMDTECIARSWMQS